MAARPDATKEPRWRSIGDVDPAADEKTRAAGSLSRLGNLIVPPRMHIQRLGSDQAEDRLIAQFNPSELEESVAPKWARLAPQGLSHEIRHFVSTGPYEIKISLFFAVKTINDLVESQRARRLLLSWANPSKVAATLSGGGGPPTLLLVWPGMLSLQCDLISVKLKHQLFNRDAVSVVYTAECSFEEQRGTFLTSEVIADGSSGRNGGPP